MAIDFIAGGELENLAGHVWHGTPLTSSDPPVSGVTGAHGKVYDLSTWGFLAHQFDATQKATGRARWRFQTSIDNQPFMHFRDGGTDQVRLIYRSTGAIEAVRQSTILATSATGLFNIDTWYELEFRLKVSNGAGEVAVNRNGAQIICIPSGADTQTTANGSIDEWVLGNEVLDSYFDDCVLDRAGEYLGTGEVETLMPNAVGDLAQLTPDSPGDNYTRVNEKPHDSNTSYVESTAADQLDVYSFENRSLSGTPMSVMLAVAARHTAGSPTFKLVCRIDGDNYESGAFSTASIFRNHFLHPWANNPATGAAWTDEAINEAQFGVHALGAGVRVTQVGLQVYVKSAESDRCLASGVTRDYCGAVNEDLN